MAVGFQYESGVSEVLSKGSYRNVVTKSRYMGHVLCIIVLWVVCEWFLMGFFWLFWFGLVFCLFIFLTRRLCICMFLCEWINLISWEIKCWLLILLMLVYVWRDLVALEHKLRNKSRSFPPLQSIALYIHRELGTAGKNLKTMNLKSTNQIKLNR